MFHTCFKSVHASICTLILLSLACHKKSYLICVEFSNITQYLFIFKQLSLHKGWRNPFLKEQLSWKWELKPSPKIKLLPLTVLIQGSLLSPYWVWSSVLPSKSGFGTPSMPADCTDCRLDLQRFLLPTYLAIDNDRTVDVVTQESGAKVVEILFWRSSWVTNGNAVML